MLGVDTVIKGGLRPLRERPAAVAVWGAIYLVAMLGGLFFVSWPMMRLQSAAMTGARPDLVDPAAMLVPIFLFNGALFLLVTILMAAGLRAMLRPEERAFASLRVGMDELRLLGLFVLLWIAFFVLMIVFTIVMSIMFAILGVASGGLGPGAGPSVGMIVAVLVMMIAIFAFCVFLQVRLSPTVALTMIRRKIIIGDAWRLTRGHFWTMFLGYLVLGLMLLVVYIAVATITMGPYFAELARSGFQPQAMIAAGQRQMASFGLMAILGMIGSGAVTGLGIAFWSGSIAAATTALLDEVDPEIGAVFE